MKTRRIHLQPGESVEIVNHYGTSMLKAVARFRGDTPCIVLFDQPDVISVNSADMWECELTLEPSSGPIDLSGLNWPTLNP